MSLAEKSKDRPSTTGQKFWPLKKFNLHNNNAKSSDQQSNGNSSPIRETQVAKVEAKVANENKSPINTEVDAQKKSKNKRLSSLLSTNRRQEESFQSPVNTNNATNVDNEITKKSENQASNTPTLTKKSGKDTKARTTTYKNHKNGSMTAKSAGSGTLTRSQMSGKGSLTPSSAPLNQPFFKSKDSKAARKNAEDKSVKNQPPSSPPSKRNDSPTHMQQPPKIMLESVQQQIQQEDEKKIKRIEKLKDRNEQLDTTKPDEDDNKAAAVDEEEFVIVNHNKKENQKKKKIQEIFPEEYEKEEVIENDMNIDIKASTSTSSSNSSDSELSDNKTLQSSFPSPPRTPAALGLSECTTANPSNDTSPNSAKDNVNGQYEPVSPTACNFDEQTNTKPISTDKPPNNPMNLNNNSLGNTVHSQQPIQRIHRLRPAASFATLRQLASTKGNYQYVQQPLQQNQLQQIKRRPVSFIEPSSCSQYNYATLTPPIPPASDDYLSVNQPIYYRRANSEDNGYYHIRHQSDSTAIQFTNPSPSPPSSVASSNNGRRLARSNTVHNVIIKDGQGHRIVQCVGLDGSPPLPPQQLRRNTSSFESNDSFHSHQYHDWSPPPEITDDVLIRQQQLEEFSSQQQLLLLNQQNHNMATLLAVAQQQQTQYQLQQQQSSQDSNADNSSSDSSMNNRSKGGNITRKMKRKDSAKSLSSLCSTSPPIMSFDVKCEQLKNTLEKERAIVKALQKQKEACSKDLLFLSKNVDELTAENTELKRKYETEKTNRERFQDDLSDSLEKLSEATEQIRNLENQNKQIRLDLEEKIKEVEKKSKQVATPPRAGKSEGKSNERLLAAQLQHSQNQVRLLKSTMEQFLRMGLFNDDLNSSTVASPTTSIDAIVSEIKCGRSKPHRSSGISTKSNNSASNDPIQIVKSKSRKSAVPSETPNHEAKPADVNKSTPTAELDIQLRELLREKEILQGEYSKAPSSGGNALVRRRREELESRLDAIDSQMCRIKLKLRNRNIL